MACRPSMIMVLIFLRADDFTSGLFYQQLLASAAVDYYFVYEKDLINDFDVEIYLKENPDEGHYFILQSRKKGVRIDSRKVKLLINHLSFFDETNFRTFIDSDIAYVMAEWNAIFLAMLTILDDKQLFNRASPEEWTGKMLPDVLVIKYAQQCGLHHAELLHYPDGKLSISNSHSAASHEFIVHDGNIFGTAILKEEDKALLLRFQRMIKLKFSVVGLSRDPATRLIQIHYCHTMPVVNSFVPGFIQYIQKLISQSQSL